MDRKKVIEGLKCCTSPVSVCGDCPYYDECVELKKDALELLKPVPAEIEGDPHSWWYVCGECHGAIDNKDKFCRHCGKQVKWE